MIHLYIKRCTHCGLKYFGKTIHNPFSYNGSGVYWKKHISHHKAEIETLVVNSFSTIEEASSFATEYSRKYSIASSEAWANLTEETALEGGNMSDTSGRRNGNYGRKHTPEALAKIRLANKRPRRKQSEETIRKRIETTRSRFDRYPGGRPKMAN